LLEGFLLDWNESWERNRGVPLKWSRWISYAIDLESMYVWSLLGAVTSGYNRHTLLVEQRLSAACCNGRLSVWLEWILRKKQRSTFEVVQIWISYATDVSLSLLF
jgi:hypothetical protein